MAEELDGMLASAVVKVACDKMKAACDKMEAALRDTEVIRTWRRSTELMKLLLRAMEDDRRWEARNPKRLVDRVVDNAYGFWDMADEIRINSKAGAAAVRADDVLQRMYQIEMVTETVLPGITMIDLKRSLAFSSVAVEKTSSSVHEAIVVGRDEQVERLLDLLLPPGAGMKDDGIRECPIFLPIFGAAGVGKTTLAQLVYNHSRSRDYYDARAWVCVSPSFDLGRIGKSIIGCLTKARYDGEEDSNVLDLDSIKRHVHELVGDGKKMLVVLDDIWERDVYKLDRLQSLFGADNQEGSKVIVDVIVTTNDEDIARKICTDNVQPYKLHPLSDDLCWTVFKRASLFEDRDDKQDLDKIGQKIIATKCGGLPLVAQTLGHMLLEKNCEQWLAFASNNDWDGLTINGDFSETLFSSLRLSYQSLPPNFRFCFAYLGTLPEWHNMAKDDIIHRWIALGLIEPTNGISTGQQIISRLLDISFLQHSNLASTSRKHDDKGVVSFTMHSLIHHFARSIMGSTLVVADGEYTRYYRIRDCRYAVLTNFDLVPDVLSATLRSLSLLGCSKMELSNESFSFAKYLQVLELRESYMQKLPDFVCQLGLLGYLNLSGCSGLVKLPESFGNLTGVVHINLSGCSGLVKLPKSFGNLTSLLHINLSGCLELVVLPKSFGNLTSLRHINLSGWSGLIELPESFGNLTSLRHINLSGCSRLKYLPKSFGNLTSVVHINFEGCHGLADLPKSFCKLSNLKFLDLSFCCCPSELQTALGGLTNLRHLNLSHPTCYAVEAKHKDHLEQLKDVWAKLTKLQYLNLSTFMNPIFCNMPEEKSRLDCFEPIFKGLSGLEDLDLSHNVFLVDLPETLCDLSNLHTLNLSGCIRLKRITKKIAEMKCTIVLRKCSNLESYSFVVHANYEAYRSNLVQLEDTVSCNELEISCLEKLKSVEDAKRIRLDEKRKLRELTLSWTGGSHVSFADDEALLTELVPPQNLQRLALNGYGGNGLPAWLTSSLLCLHLPNLEELTMENIPKCHALPPFLLLPKLKQVVIRKMDGITRIDAGELSGGASSRADLHRLLKFTLDDMENLQEFNTIYRSGSEEFMFPTIDELVIQNCPNLKFGHLLPTAPRLQISACDQLMFTVPKREAGEQGKSVVATSSSTSSAATPRVAQLVVEKCMVPLSDWSLLSHLPGLCSLEIRGSNDLIGSPETTALSSETTHALSSLQSLRFYQCNNMTSLPEFLGDLTSLQELTIDDCQDIESLPDSIAKLRNLKDLCILGCPKLQEWRKSADNKQKLSHIHIRESATVEPGTTANQTTNKQLT